MSKRMYYFIISIAVLAALSAVVLYFLDPNQNLGSSLLFFFNGVALGGIGYMNMKKKEQ